MSIQIPLNPQSDAGSDGFALIYDPEAVRFARKVNGTIGAVVGVLSLAAILWVLYRVNAAVADSAPAEIRLLSEFALPIGLLGLAIVLGIAALKLFGFDLSTVYSRTEQAFQEWLPSHSKPLKLDHISNPSADPSIAFSDELNRGFKNAVSEEVLDSAVKDIARGVGRTSILSPDGLLRIQKDADGLYRVAQ